MKTSKTSDPPFHALALSFVGFLLANPLQADDFGSSENKFSIDFVDVGNGGNGVNRTATGVSWNEATRFVKWLNTSKGYSAAYKFADQPGEDGYSANADLQLWESGDTGYDANNWYRNADATYFPPSDDEWYKAAYYSGTGTTYTDYALGNNTRPTPTSGNTDLDSAVYNGQSGPADVT